MALTLFPVLLMIVGLLAFALSANPKISEAGKIAYFCGLLVVTMALANHTIRVG